MKWERLLSKGFIVFLIVFLIFAIAAISTPFWLPKVTTLGEGEGHTGDAVGGISSPFITLIMALLAFLAFWMQYQTLRDQRCEINRNHFEERLSLMLSQLRENANNLKAGSKIGRSAAEELAGELYLIISLVTSNFERVSEDIRNGKDFNDQQRAKLILYYDELKGDEQKCCDYLMRTAYGIFFQGKNYTPNVVDNEERVLLTQLIEAKLKKEQYSIDNNSHYSNLLFEDNPDLSSFNKVPYLPFQGHNAEMGCYYRHLYQIIKVIAFYPQNEMSEDEKYSYAKLVRSHLSDYEQFLLYYNSLSDFGDVWNKPLYSNEKYPPLNMGLLSRFRMVKNLPGNIVWRGMCPIDKYENEICEWKKLNHDFFETPHFLTLKSQ